MEETFKAAATAQKSSGLIFTSDCQGTLYHRKQHFELLEFLSDAKRIPGNQVFLTTAASDMGSVNDVLELMIDIGRMKGYDMLDLNEFQRIEKYKLMAMNLAVDVAFDDEPIAQQTRIVSRGGNLIKESLQYTTPALEIRVLPDFTTSPYTLDQLRVKYNIPKRGIGDVQPTPIPHPA